MGEAFQILSLVAVGISVYYLAIQTKRLQEQVKTNNLSSRYEALNNASVRYDNGLMLIFQAPELRPYIFGRREVDLQGDDFARAMSVVDLMAGAVDYALRVGSRFPDELGSDWDAVAEAMANQPIFHAIVSEQPQQFPDLLPYFDRGAASSQS